jgi:hypothetical protein
LGIELPPLKCGNGDFGDDGVDVSVGALPGADGGIGVVITITPPDSPVSVNIVPFPPFILPGLNWDFFFGPTKIDVQKDIIKNFLTPVFRFVRDNYGYRLPSNNAVRFDSSPLRARMKGYPELDALRPFISEDTETVLNCFKVTKEREGFAKRFVNQYLGNAAYNDWTVDQTTDLWDAMIAAMTPLPSCPPQCMTATQLLKYMLTGQDVPEDAKGFLADKTNWDTAVLYCFPSDWQLGDCPPPVQPPPEQPPPQPVDCPPGMIRNEDGTCFCPLPPEPPTQPEPPPPPVQPPPIVPQQPPAQGCPPECQQQIDVLRDCCDALWRAIATIWLSINAIWDTISLVIPQIWLNINNIWTILDSLDVRINNHIENYWITIIKPYIDEMCERCKSQAQPPPTSQDEPADECERGRKWWGRWAECWLNANSPFDEEIELDPEDHEPVAGILYVMDANDPDDEDTRGWGVMQETYATLMDALEDEETQRDPFITSEDGSTFGFEEVGA